MTKLKNYHIIFIFIFLSTSLFSQKRKQYYHPLSNNFMISLGGGTNYSFSDYENPSPGWLINGKLEYYFQSNSPHTIGFAVNGGIQNINAKLNYLGLPNSFDTQILEVGTEIIYSFAFNKNLLPFLSVGGSYALYDFSSKNIKSKYYDYSNGKVDNSLVLDSYAGVKYKVSEIVSLNFSAGYHYVLNDNIDAIAVGDYNDFYITGQIGISFSLWNKVDSDNDGINDNVDQCPNEAEDIDGFQDDDGCPDYDNDGDGILDIYDGCQNSKEDMDGYQDEDGCPDVDNDGDGILDIFDKCPNQKEDMDGFQDDDGCPEIDNDNDGILDVDDKCPNEAEVFNGYQDDDGCPDKAPRTEKYYNPKPKKVIRPKKKKKKTSTPDVSNNTNVPSRFILHGGNTFLSGSAQIKSSAFAELNRIANLMMTAPNAMWSIEAHIDRAKNSMEAKTLTKQQANAIMNYFISKGLPAGNFRTIGKGDSSPIASNSSVYGRMKNRRIVIRRIN